MRSPGRWNVQRIERHLPGHGRILDQRDLVRRRRSGGRRCRRRHRGALRLRPRPRSRRSPLQVGDSLHRLQHRRGIRPAPALLRCTRARHRRLSAKAFKIELRYAVCWLRGSNVHGRSGIRLQRRRPPSGRAAARASGRRCGYLVEAGPACRGRPPGAPALRLMAAAASAQRRLQARAATAAVMAAPSSTASSAGSDDFAAAGVGVELHQQGDSRARAACRSASLWRRALPGCGGCRSRHRHGGVSRPWPGHPASCPASGR